MHPTNQSTFYTPPQGKRWTNSLAPPKKPAKYMHACHVPSPYDNQKDACLPRYLGREVPNHLRKGEKRQTMPSPKRNPYTYWYRYQDRSRSEEGEGGTHIHTPIPLPPSTP